MEKEELKLGKDFNKIMFSNGTIVDFSELSKGDKHTKGYIFDSLVYRYIRAREQMAEYEWLKDSTKQHDKKYYYRQANRDIMRFCQILDEAIGEHD